MVDDYLEYDKALEDYQTAIDISSDEEETQRAINNRGLIYRDQEKHPKKLSEERMLY